MTYKAVKDATRLADQQISILKEVGRKKMSEVLTWGDGLEQVINILVASFRGGGKLLLCGNGGSAADCDHVAAELMCRYQVRLRPPLPAISLAACLPTITAIANDYGFTEVFDRQVQALGKPGDVLMAFSTSGQSVNVLRALRAAKHREMFRLGFTGAGDRKIFADLCDVCVRAPSEETGAIQEWHRIFYHRICGAVEKEMFS